MLRRGLCGRWLRRRALPFGRGVAAASWRLPRPLLQAAAQPRRHQTRVVHIRGGDVQAEPELPSPEGLKEELRMLFDHVDKGLYRLSGLPEVPEDGVFANNMLDMSGIQVYGADFDYSLIQYKGSLQLLIFDLAKRYMVEHLGYPDTLHALQYDPNFPIRGLHLDTKTGVILKLNDRRVISDYSAHFGKKRLSKQEVDNYYHGSHISLNYYQTYLRVIGDLFYFSEVDLISSIVQMLVDEGSRFYAGYILEDVRKAIDFVHSSGALWNVVSADPAQYVHYNDSLVAFLQQIQKKGKETFLLSNNSFENIDPIFSYLCPDWRSLFNVIVTRADKPRFFSSSRPFRALVLRGSGNRYLNWNPITEFRDGAVYVQGNLTELAKLSGWVGEDVLYIGDHLHNDLVEPVRQLGWRSCAIVSELAKEIAVQNSSEYKHLLASAYALQNMRARLRTHLATVRNAQETSPDSLSIARICEDHIMLVEAEHGRVWQDIRGLYNKRFGSAFKTHKRTTEFASQVTQFADIYTADITNLAKFTDHFFRPPTRVMPHDIRYNLCSGSSLWDDSGMIVGC